MTANIWVIRKESRYDMAGALCGSLIIHVVLFFLMASTSIYYPATGDAAQFDIFWFSPSTSPMEATTLAAMPEVASATDVIPEQTDVKPDTVEPPQFPVVDKKTEPSAQPPHEQTDENPPVELIAARAAQAKPPLPPVKPPSKPKKTAILIPKAEPEREKGTKAVEPPDRAETAKAEAHPEGKPEPPPPPPPPQPPLPPEKDGAAIAEEQRQAALSARHERLAQEKAERQRQEAERVEQEQRAAEAALEKAEQKRLTAEAAREKTDQERKAAESARLKTEQERLTKLKAEREQRAAAQLQQEKLARERQQAAAEAAREKAEQKRRAAEAAREKDDQERQAAEAARLKAEQERLASQKAERELRAAAQLQQEKLAREREQAAEEKAGRERLAAERVRLEKLALERKQVEEKAERDRQAAEIKRRNAEQDRLLKEKTERERRTAERARLEKSARELERMAAEKAERERQAAEALRRSAEQERLGAERIRLAALARAQAEQRAAEAVPKETPKPRPAEPPPIARGIVIPSIHGDLKLIIAESNNIKLTVLFREYPKSRWNRGLTRSEARREQKITPIVVKTKEKTREAIIEKTREGIYTFMAEPDGAPSATATFTLKSYEQSQRAKTKPLGAKIIAGKAIVARILMPDAVLWEDESSFTGSMEDSGGVTKFNSETGLVWKEYRD